MSGILFCGITSAQTNNKISVDRDSLFKVFINYEGCKLSLVALSADKINLNEIIASREIQIEKYRQQILLYDSVIVPGYLEKDRLRLDQISETKKNGRRKAKKNFINGTVTGGIISLILLLI